MHSESRQFLEVLFGRLNPETLSQNNFTLSTIHPTLKNKTPVLSYHLALTDPEALTRTLNLLDQKNREGLGIFASIATCRRGLPSNIRGSRPQIRQVPALWVDVDGQSLDAARLRTLENSAQPPSAIISSGGGWHAYWWLENSLTNLEQADQLLKQLADRHQGDHFTCTQPMRLPGSRNTKPERHNALCHILSWHPRRTYQPADFGVVNPPPPTPSPPARPTTQTNTSLQQRKGYDPINPLITQQVADRLTQDYQGHLKSNGWLSARCPYQHEHDQVGEHFNYNPALGLGYCFGKHKRVLLKELCQVLGINLTPYGNTIYNKTKEEKVCLSETP